MCTSPKRIALRRQIGVLMSNLIRKAIILKALPNVAKLCSKNYLVPLKAEQFGSGTAFTCSTVFFNDLKNEKFLRNDRNENTENRIDSADALDKNMQNRRAMIFVIDEEQNFCTQPISPPNELDLNTDKQFLLSGGFAAVIYLTDESGYFFPILIGKTADFKFSDRGILDFCEKNFKENEHADIDKEKNVFLREKRREGDFGYGEQSRNGYAITGNRGDRSGGDDEATDGAIRSDVKSNFNADRTVFAYNDEAVATENFYENNLNGDNYEPVSFKTDETAEQKTNNQSQAFDEFDAFKDESSVIKCPFEKNMPAYYCSIKEKIEPLFSKYEPISRLSELIPESKWVKIEYKNNGYYIVGIICEERIPRYVVYGVPGNRNFKPRGFESYSIFLPESLFEQNGKGYWCMFQNAETGESETPDDD